jgi:antitoxin ParD1/3/4
MRILAPASRARTCAVLDLGNEFAHCRLRQQHASTADITKLSTRQQWHNMSNFAINGAYMTLNVSLPMELEARVRAHVASGRYGSASEVIREALRLFEAYQSVQQSSLAALRADIAQGMADVNAGRVEKMDMASIKTQGRALKKPS